MRIFLLMGTLIISGLLLGTSCGKKKEVRRYPLLVINEGLESEKLPAESGKKSEVREKVEIPAQPAGTELDIKAIKKVSNGGECVEYGEFTMKVNLHRNKTVKVYYAIPLGADGKPGPNAYNMIFLAPSLNAKNLLNRKNKKGRNVKNKNLFGVKDGFSMFSMDIVSDISEVEDRDKIYYYKESGWHDIVFKIQEILCKKFNLKRRKLLIAGFSSGASMAEQMAVHYPGRIDAIAIGGGHRYDPPEANNRVAWLSLHVAGDDYSLKSEYLLDYYARKIGVQILHLELPVFWERKGKRLFHHGAGDDGIPLMASFIRGIVSLREKNNGVLPHYTQWPEKERYDGKEWYLPSLEFAELWKQYPKEELLAVCRDKIKAVDPIYFIPNSGVDPKCVVVYIHDPDCDDDLKLVDCLYYFLSEKNAIACSVRVSDNYFETLKRIEKLIEDVRKRKKWARLPLYVCGLGVGGQLAAVAAFKKGETFEQKSITKHFKGGEITRKVRVRHARVRKITTINSPFDWPFPELSLGRTAWKRKSQIPLNMIFSSNYQGVIPGNSKYREVKRIDVDDFSLGKKWFETLSDIADGK